MSSFGIGVGTCGNADDNPLTLLAAAMQCDFTTATLDPRITFTNASTTSCTTFTGSDGLLKTMGANFVRSSEDLTSIWNSVGATVTKTTVVFNGASSTTNIVNQPITSGWTLASQTVTVSFTASTSNASGNLLKLRMSNGVDQTNGDPTITLSTTPTRYSSTFTFNATVPSGQMIRFWTADATTAAATLTITNVQLELGSVANTYSPTTTAANSGPRFDYDPATPAGTTGVELAATTSVTLTGSVGVVAYGVSTFTLAKTYKVSYTYSLISGSIQAGNGGSLSTGAVQTGTVSGTYSYYATCISTANAVLLYSNAAVGSISNISVQEVTFTPRGLLIEEARTNLLLQSRDMTQAAWTKTDVTPARTQVGLDGTANSACLMTEGSAGTALTSQDSGSVTAGATVTDSIVIKRGNTDWVRVMLYGGGFVNYNVVWFNLGTGVKGSVSNIGTATGAAGTITNLGGGWYRLTVSGAPDTTYTVPKIAFCSASADASATRVSGATYIVDYAQLEVGAFATSPIATAAATVTRAADSASMTGTNFSSWYSQTQGTFVAESDSVNYAGATAYVLTANNGNVTDMLYVRRDGGLGRFVSLVANVAQANLSATGTPSIATVKQAFAYASADFSATANGGTPVTAASGTLPTVNQLQIGNRQDMTTSINGHIRRLTYYPTRLPNATLQALTA